MISLSPDSEVFLEFTSPSTLGATSYTLQFSPASDPDNFVDVMNGTTPYTTSSTEVTLFSVEMPPPENSGFFRIRITGGAYDGQYSNVESATRCLIDANINWGLDYSLAITGTVSPYVGCGIEASFPLVDDEDNAIEDALTYQWYRVNPNDYSDKTLLVGETSLTYITTVADINYHLMIKATGTSEKFPGGLCNAMTYWIVKAK